MPRRPSPYDHTDPGTFPVPVINLPDTAITVINTVYALTPGEVDRLSSAHTSTSPGRTALVEKALNTAWAAGRRAGIMDTGRNPNLPDLLSLIAAISPAAYLAVVAAITEHLVDPAITRTLTRAWTIAKLPYPGRGRNPYSAAA